MGWVQPVFDGNYTFVTEVNDGARLWVNDELLFDEFETEASSEVEGSYETYSGLAQDLKGGVLYPIQLDVRENYNSATIRLLWSSDEQLLEIIPSYRLFYGETRIANSPFVVDVAPRKSGPPEGLSLEIIGADALQALFYPPADDGGESITSYLVEWWDASLDGLQTPEVQEIVIDSRIDGGTFVMTWPAGSGYANSRPLPWNATAVQVEYELESSNPELRDVSVDLDSSSHTYSVTFLSERGNVPYMLEVDPSSLTSSSVSVPIGDRVSINEIVPGVSVGTLWETMNVDKTTIPHRALVDGLSQDSTTPEGFSVRVSARNSAGAGLPCSAATMKPAAPPGPQPEGAIVLIPGSSTSLKVRWSHPVDDFGSIVTSFEVKYTPFGGSAIVMMGSTDTFSSLSRGLGHYDAILSSLPLGVPHLVSIAAVNAMGTGEELTLGPIAPGSVPTAAELTVSTISASDFVSVADSVQSLVVHLNSPDDNSFPVLDYTVEWWLANEGFRHAVQVIQASAPGALPPSGSFQLGLDGFSTDWIPADGSVREMASALKAIPSVRELQVTRSAVTSGSGYAWMVTFLSDLPPGPLLVVESELLGVSGASVTVGHDLVSGLPGYEGTATATAVAGSKSVTVGGDVGGISVGSWITLDGEQYIITETPNPTEIILGEPYKGAALSLAPAPYGFTVSGMQPPSYGSTVVDSPTETKLISGLEAGELYVVRATSRNAIGYGTPVLSSPIAPPRQPPSPPREVQVFPASATSEGAVACLRK